MYSHVEGSIGGTASAAASAQATKPELLDRLAADHIMQRSICALLGRIADDLHRPNRHFDAAAVHRYVTELLPLHVKREERQLYMQLKRHEYPGDDVEQMFELLRAGHRDTFQLADELTDGLSTIAGGGLPRRPNDFIVTAHAFNHLLRALVAWEDETIIPYARMRL